MRRLMIVSSLLDEAGKEIGEIRFNQVADGYAIESVQIVGEAAMEALRLRFSVTDHHKGDVTVFTVNEKL